MSQFDALLDELESLQKAYAVEDGGKKIAAAGYPEPDEPDEPDEDDEDDEDGFEPMSKTFAFELDNGKTIEAIDATHLIKNLGRKLEKSETLLAKSIEERDALHGRVLALLKSQAAELDGLRKQVAKLSSEGRGRKAVVNVHEAVDPAPMTKSVSPTELLTKSHAAAEAGRITWKECAEIDASIRLGQIPNQAILAKLG